MEQVKSYGAPVEAIQPLLGGFYEREYSGLSRLCGLIREICPKKIVKVGEANSSTTAAVLSCIDLLELPCQLYVVDPLNRHFPHCKEAVQFEKELEHRKNCRLFLGHTPAAFLDKIGGGIDLLILDPSETMPGDVLDFIAALPYLAQNAVIVLCSTLPDGPRGNVLLQSVTADKVSTHFTPYFDIRDCVKLAAVDIISIFQITAETAKRCMDLFAALGCPWSYIPTLEQLLEYETIVKRHYDSESLELYKHAILEADPNKKMLSYLARSLLRRFPEILLYGKGIRGQYFLKLSRLLGIHVTGFVVSDDQDAVKSCRDLPVYSYSQIPFSRNDVFIFQTANSIEIERRLQESNFYWLKLPENFWRETC